jgi:hypothetical protein
MSRKSARLDESESRALQEFEEVSGEFRGFKISEDRERILVTLTLTCSIILPLQLDLLKQLKRVKVGQRIAVLQSEDTKVWLRPL